MVSGIVVIMVAVLLIVVVINATRIQNLRNDLDGGSPAVPLPEVESLVIRAGSGERVPKTAYWVSLGPDTTPAGEVERLSVSIGDTTGDHDGVAFDADVARGRIKYVYRPDQRSLFSIERTGGRLLVRPMGAGSASLRFTPSGMVGARKMTIIGIPQALVTPTAGTS